MRRVPEAVRDEEVRAMYAGKILLHRVPARPLAAAPGRVPRVKPLDWAYSGLLSRKRRGASPAALLDVRWAR